MKMKSLSDDDFVTSWLAAESVNCLKTKDNFDRKETRTKLHKIIYLVADNHNIPVTRGWYMYGPFIYNNNVLNLNYSKNIRTWSSKSYNLDDDFKSIKKYDFNIDEIKTTIKKIVDLISKYSADECIYILYKKYAPEKFKTLYLQKYNFTGIRTNINSILNYYNGKFQIDRSHEPSWYINKLLEDIDTFEIEAYSIFDDEEIEYTSERFFSFFREILWKSELILEKTGLNKNILSGITFSQKCFEKSIWSSYSGLIINETAKGVKKSNAQAMGRRTRKKSLKNAPRNLTIYKNRCIDRGLKLSYADMKNHNRNKNSSELDRKLLNLVKLTSCG